MEAIHINADVDPGDTVLITGTDNYDGKYFVSNGIADQFRNPLLLGIDRIRDYFY